MSSDLNPSCDHGGPKETVKVVAGQKFVALVGAPNSGKTTLYNQLTRSSFKTVNYPGSTVEYAMGICRAASPFLVFDTPGIYSLFPKSTDEEVTQNILYQHPTLGSAHRVVVVVDATQLRRHLYLVKQIKEAGFKTIIAVTMMDLIEESKQNIDLKKLSSEMDCPVYPIWGLTGGGIKELAGYLCGQIAQSSTEVKKLLPWDIQKQKEELIHAQKVSQMVLSSPTTNSTNSPYAKTKKLDRIFLHPILGMIIFILTMAAIFWSVFSAAGPLMDAIDTFFVSLADWTMNNAPLPTLWKDFLANGLITSLGAVLIFVPQIAILFLGLTLLEDTGYLARAASMFDRPLRAIGLNGRAFVPILSGYACAIPAMMAARAIPNRIERMLTLFILPLMSCSARLPVFALLLGFLFRGAPAWQPGLALAGIYLLSLVISAIVSASVNAMIKKTDPSFFMMELPLYRRPHIRSVFKTVLSKTESYIRKAAPMIFIFAVIMWGLSTFPNYEIEDLNTRVEQSYAAKLGTFIEPVMEPMGGDWRVGFGLISAFAAREVFVSSLAIVFHTSEEDENSLLDTISSATTSTGAPLFTTASVIGLILFFLVALQCMATYGIARKEFGSIKIATIQLIAFNILAYGLAVAAVQGLRALGVS